MRVICRCEGRGYLLDQREQIACDCPDGLAWSASALTPEQKPPPRPRNRATEIGVLVDELLVSWTDRDRDKHTGLLHLLAEHTTPVRMVGSDGAGRHAKVTGSPAPWAADVENVITTVTAGAIDLERDLRRLLGYATVTRSSTDRSGHQALAALHPLYDQAWTRGHERHWLLTGPLDEQAGRYRPGQVERHLVLWHRQAREVLGAYKRRERLRDVDGKHLLCTSCGQPALYQDPNSGAVTCRQCRSRWTWEELGWLDHLTHIEGATS